MNATHIHLMMKHLPVIGTFVGLGLLLFGLARKSQELTKTALGVLIIGALFVVPVYLSGEPAEDTVKNMPGVLRSSIEAHEEAASVALASALAVGLVALGGLIWRRKRAMPGWFLSVALAGSILSAGIMAWTANLGGKVRHTEISNAGSASAETTRSHHD